ncbi:MAG: regulator of CtrA degradation rcdA [Maricaulis sp.]|jgi:regulator of CtrA degradation|nr:regulator of CtrA degradation rcdA [Maricaulis sp.]HAQ36327.1 DUF1465 domain-containing protein [Alphaproteobacteria bacterium]
MTETFVTSGQAATPATRVADFVASEMFSKLFHEGMDLVERTAAYLDGPGRDDSRALDRAGALAYAAESMKLTTRLMQAASWLLVQRQVAEGEMSADEAMGDRYRLPPDSVEDPHWPENGAAAPAALTEIASLSRALYARLKRIDENLFAGEPEDASVNGVGAQLDRLRTAFGN